MLLIHHPSRSPSSAASSSPPAGCTKSTWTVCGPSSSSARSCSYPASITSESRTWPSCNDPATVLRTFPSTIDRQCHTGNYYAASAETAARQPNHTITSSPVILVYTPHRNECAISSARAQSFRRLMGNTTLTFNVLHIL